MNVLLISVTKWRYLKWITKRRLIIKSAFILIAKRIEIALLFARNTPKSIVNIANKIVKDGGLNHAKPSEGNAEALENIKL